VPQFTDAQPVGGVARQPDGENKLWTTAISDRRGDSLDQFRRHVRQFLDCVKRRKQPVSDLDSGQRVATWCHLANLSLRLGRSLHWDAVGETVRGDDLAAALMSRPYRAPWDGVLKAVLS
jgi:hypothetical protein